jgi:hypothetical protein
MRRVKQVISSPVWGMTSNPPLIRVRPIQRVEDRQHSNVLGITMNASDEADEKQLREWAGHTYLLERTKDPRICLNPFDLAKSERKPLILRTGEGFNA